MVTREVLLKQKQGYADGKEVTLRQIYQLKKNVDATDGAIQAIDVLLAELDKQEAAKEEVCPAEEKVESEKESLSN